MIMYHVHNDGILDGWIERLDRDCSNRCDYNCHRFKTLNAAKRYLIRKWQMDVDYLKRNIREAKKIKLEDF